MKPIHNVGAKNRLIYLLLLLTQAATGLVCILLDSDTVKHFAAAIYLFHYVILLLVILRQQDQTAAILSPGFLTASYVALSFAVGAYAFQEDLVWSRRDYFNYLNWSAMQYSTGYMILSNTAAVLSYLLLSKRKLRSLPARKSEVRFRSRGRMLLVAALAAPVMVGGLFLRNWAGNEGIYQLLTTVPATVAAIIACYAIAQNHGRLRWLLYALMVLAFAAAFYHDKRVVVTVLMMVAFFEVITRSRIEWRFKWAMRGVAMAAAGFLLIVSMSILRGYGGYRVDGVIDAMSYLGKYIDSDDFLNMFFNNIEVSYTFFHSHHGVELIIDGDAPLSYGATIAKAALVPIPGSIVEKPASIIDRYTSAYDPLFRARGGSWVVNVYTEMFWNFHFLGVIAVFLIMLVANAGYLRFVKAVRSGQGLHHIGLMVCYAFFPIYVRGSGLDLYVVYVIAATAAGVMLTKLVTVSGKY